MGQGAGSRGWVEGCGSAACPGSSKKRCKKKQSQSGHQHVIKTTTNTWMGQGAGSKGWVTGGGPTAWPGSTKGVTRTQTV
jgi:hypothetical protein